MPFGSTRCLTAGSADPGIQTQAGCMQIRCHVLVNKRDSITGRDSDRGECKTMSPRSKRHGEYHAAFSPESLPLGRFIPHLLQRATRLGALMSTQQQIIAAPGCIKLSMAYRDVVDYTCARPVDISEETPTYHERTPVRRPRWRRGLPCSILVKSIMHPKQGYKGPLDQEHITSDCPYTTSNAART